MSETDKLTKEQFTVQYAKNSNMTPEQLAELHQEAVVCDCKEDDCKGWQMITKTYEECDYCVGKERTYTPECELNK